MMRVRVLTNIPTPYNDALYAALAARPDVDLRVAYCARTESNRSWVLPDEKPYAYDILPGWTLRSSVHVNPGVAGWIDAQRPDVAVVSGGYNVPTIQAAAWMLSVRRIPWLFWGEELALEAGHGLQRRARSVLRTVIRRASAVLAIGERACRSYAAIGVPPDRIHDFHYYPAVDRFRMEPARRDAARTSLRVRWNIPPNALVFAFCGQLVHRKGVDTLLQAVARLQASADECVVAIIGDGPEQQTYERLARALHVGDHVRFAGFAQPDALPGWFAAADALVVPSRREGWGLVVGEAMAAGLPVIASSEVNAARDLIASGGAGSIVPPDDPAALAHAMRALLVDPALRYELRSRALRTADEESPEQAAVRLDELLRAYARADRVGTSLTPAVEAC